MVEKLLSRRNLFKIAVGTAAVGTAATADIGYATKIGKPKYEITQEFSSKIEQEASELIPYIDSLTSTVIAKNNKAANVTPDPEIFARYLVSMAYLDGGEEGLRQVKSLIKERRLHLSIDNLPKAAASTKFSLSQFDPIDIIFDPDFIIKYCSGKPSVPKESAIWHELYHVIQQSRDPELIVTQGRLKVMALLNVGLGVGIASGMGVYKMTTGENKTTRRKLLGISAGLIAGITTMPAGYKGARMAAYFIAPSELQAYTQTGFRRSTGMLVENYLQKNIGKAFIYQEKSTEPINVGKYQTSPVR